jgi:SnoaL-like domain
MEHPNVELYRRVTAAFQSGDIDAVKAALAPGLRWHEAGNAEVMGREAVLQQMSRAVKRIDGTSPCTTCWPTMSTSSP